jgi:hypothetical protein
MFLAGWSASSVHRDHVRGTFAQRQHCIVLANHFLKQQQEDFGNTASLILGRIGYSGTRASCIAEVTTYYAYPAPTERMISIYDLLSRSSLFSDICSDRPCKKADDDRIQAGSREAFDRLVKE